MRHTPANTGIIQELKAFRLFEYISEVHLKKLCSTAQIVLTEHKEPLFEAFTKANFFYLVLSGAYKLSKQSPSGEPIILHFSPPGDVIGALIMSQPNPYYPITTTSIGPSRALKIPRDIYLEHWQTNVDLILRIQNLLTQRMLTMQNQRALSKSPLQSKVASLLISLIDKQSEIKDNVQVPIPLTRKEIADSVGSTVESIIRIMSDWSKKGYISTNNQTITIVKADKIVEIIYSE